MLWLLHMTSRTAKNFGPCWWGPHSVSCAANDFAEYVENFRDDQASDVYATRLKFYSDASLVQKLLLSHLLASETCMEVESSLRSVPAVCDLKFSTSRTKRPSSENTVGPFRDLSTMFPNALTCLPQLGLHQMTFLIMLAATLTFPEKNCNASFRHFNTKSRFILNKECPWCRI